MSGALTSPYSGVIGQAEQTYGVPTGLLGSLLNQESSMNPLAYNPAGPGGGAYGIAQFTPPTAAALGVNPLDPTSSINGAAQYLSQLQQQTGSWVSALQSYGTLPSNLSTMTSGQQTVYNAAVQADSASGGSYSLLSGNDTAFPASGPSATLGGVTAAGSQAAGQIGGAVKGFFSDTMLRIGVGILSIALVVIGTASLAFRTGPIQMIKKVM